MLRAIDRNRRFPFDEILPSGERVRHQAVATAIGPQGEPILLDSEGRAYQRSIRSGLLHERIPEFDLSQEGGEPH